MLKLAQLHMNLSAVLEDQQSNSRCRLRGISLFAGAGIGETYLANNGIDIIIANELIKSRAELNSQTHKNTKVICGDFLEKSVFDKVCKESGDRVDFIMASPPCQGMSIAGKNRKQSDLMSDRRNYFILSIIDAVKKLSPTYVMIENVPTFLKLQLAYNGESMLVLDILKKVFRTEYEIDSRILNSADYGVPQNRLRAIIKMNKKGTQWNWPEKSEVKITVSDAIGHLPSLEAGEKSNIKWHYARKHTQNNIECMKYTPTGESAFNNKIHYPKKTNGEKVKGYQSSYRRIRWDEPSPTITIRNDCIASQRNVHPGRKNTDGTYSDARVLTPLELFLLTSLPQDWNIPDDTPEILIRQCIGEAIPPLMVKAITKGIKR